LATLLVAIHHLGLGLLNDGLRATQRALSSIADADLTCRVDGEFKGIFADLQRYTNAVGETLVDVAGQLKRASGALKTATSDILAGADDLSTRTIRQAATIEETSRAMEMLAGTVTQNAERAGEASGVATTVSDTAEEGGQVMDRATEAMERITQSSAKISNIIGLIDDVAFQTNLLALNASVEAARAGEAGKGFAVVAVEVRRLAQSAAEASSQVKALIEESATEIDIGTKLVCDAAAKLVAMRAAARSSNELIDGSGPRTRSNRRCFYDQRGCRGLYRTDTTLSESSPCCGSLGAPASIGRNILRIAVQNPALAYDLRGAAFGAS
jgi:methyl-accepting chemotaxis protein